MTTFDTLRNRASRPRRTVPVILDGALYQQIEELLQEQKDLAAQRSGRLASKPTARWNQIEAELDRLYAAVADSTMHVVMEGLPGTEWAAFRATRPPRADSKIDEGWGVDCGSEAQAALIRACAVGFEGPPAAEGEPATVTPFGGPTDEDPDAEDQLGWLLGFASDSQLDNLHFAALAVCRRRDAAPLRPGHSTTATSDDE